MRLKLLCQPQAAAFVVVLPVIQIIVIGQHHRHVRSVIGEFVHGPRPGAQRMRRAPPLRSLCGRVIQGGQQQRGKGHVIAQRHARRRAVFAAQRLAKPAIVRLVAVHCGIV